MEHSSEIAVVGGGLAGLATAVLLARRGRSVTLFEQEAEVGGRARTQRIGRFLFDLGPHVIYPAGHASTILRDLGLRFGMGFRPRMPIQVVRGDERHKLSWKLCSLLGAHALKLPARLEALMTLRRLAGTDPKTIADQSLQDWLASNGTHSEFFHLVRGMIRLYSYCDDPSQQSAGAYVQCARLAMDRGPFYVDGGWQVLVDGLLRAAQEAGVTVSVDATIDRVEPVRGGRMVHIADGKGHSARVVVLAISPAAAARLLDEDEGSRLKRWVNDTTPTKVACLSLGLDRLPDPDALLAFAVERPLVLSVHSSMATLAEEGCALIHAVKCLPAGPPGDPNDDQRELETFVDVVQPGWRQSVIERRFQPCITVANAMAKACHGGPRGRPGPAVPETRDLYVVGDWVGSEGMLADASLASAKRAAKLIAPT